MEARPQRPPRTPLQRALVFLGVFAFAGFGIFFFGGRMPADALLRFDLPPTIRGPHTSYPRSEVSRIEADLISPEGQRAASVSVAIPRGLVGPRSPPVPVRLKPGSYAVRARVIRDSAGDAVSMSGIAKIDDGEIVVELDSAR
jgi:hypothetical protein